MDLWTASEATDSFQHLPLPRAGLHLLHFTVQGSQVGNDVDARPIGLRSHRAILLHNRVEDCHDAGKRRLGEDFALQVAHEIQMVLRHKAPSNTRPVTPVQGVMDDYRSIVEDDGTDDGKTSKGECKVRRS